MLTKEALEHLKCVQFRCPGSLVIKNEHNSELSCELCKFDYKSVNGIPILFSEENLKTLKTRFWDQKENANSYTDKYDKYLRKEGAPWELIYSWPEIYAIKRLLDINKFDEKNKIIMMKILEEVLEQSGDHGQYQVNINNISLLIGLTNFILI